MAKHPSGRHIRRRRQLAGRKKGCQYATIEDAAIAKYNLLVHALFEKHGVPGIKGSLAMFQRALGGIDYGLKLKTGVDWLLQCLPEDYNSLSSYHQKEICRKAILAGNVTIGSSPNDPVMTAYHQAKESVISVLEAADTEDAMREIIRQRMVPTKYCRPTAAPREGQVKSAMQKLGDFTNTVMTLEGSIKHGAVVLSTPSVGTEGATVSSMGAFSTMLPAKKAPESRAAGFSARCSPIQTPICSISGLMDRLRQGKPFSISHSDLTQCRAFETTLDNDKIQYPFLWAFTNDKNGAYNLPHGTFAKVLGILPFPNKSFLFILENACEPRGKLLNCCFPEFLKPAYQRDCRTAFETLNRTLPAVIPEGVALACGVGTSVSKQGNKLIRSFKVKYEDGKTDTIIYG